MEKLTDGEINEALVIITDSLLVMLAEVKGLSGPQELHTIIEKVDPLHRRMLMMRNVMVERHNTIVAAQEKAEVKADAEQAAVDLTES